MTNDPRLNELLTELRRTKRTRRLRGGAVLACAVVLLVGAPVVYMNSAPSPQSPAQGPSIAGGPGAPESDPIERPGPEQVAPAPSSRLIVVSNATAPTSVRKISDDELLDTLNSSGRRTGLIKRGNDVFLDADWLTHADDERDDDQSGEAATNPRV
jgi:hypothetical protein